MMKMGMGLVYPFGPKQGQPVTNEGNPTSTAIANAAAGLTPNPAGYTIGDALTAALIEQGQPAAATAVAALAATGYAIPQSGPITVALSGVSYPAAVAAPLPAAPAAVNPLLVLAGIWIAWKLFT